MAWITIAGKRRLVSTELRARDKSDSGRPGVGSMQGTVSTPEALETSRHTELTRDLTVGCVYTICRELASAP
eukprot:5177849-Prymnesium_polylepis.1